MHAPTSDSGPVRVAYPAPQCRVLIVDPDIDARRLERYADGTGLLQVIHAGSVDAAVATREPVDVIVLDVAAAPAATLPAQLERLRRALGSADGIAVTAREDDLATRVAAARAGASCFIVKPICKQTLRATVRRLRGRSTQMSPRVLIIDDDPDYLAMTEKVLTDAGYETVALTDSEPLLENLRRVRPDAILVDLGMPRYDGLAITEMLRNGREFDDTPILFVSGHRDPASIRAAYAAGADDFLTKPVAAADLTVRINARIQRSRRLRNAAERDPLTGLLTRGPFEAAAENRIASDMRNNSRTTMCLIDLDRFKRINDRHGHDVGDEVLAAFGQLLRNEFRAEDLKCRWGGEEFAIVFAGEHELSVAHGLVERLLERFASLRFEGADHRFFTASFSAGLAQMSPELIDIDDLIKVADNRLYLAKQRGRSRVVSRD